MLHFVGIGVVLLVVAYFVLFRKPRAIALDPNLYRTFRLTEKRNISHNTIFFRFALDSPSTRLGLPVGKHMLIKNQASGVSRPYTPVSSDDDLGHFDLVIKVYEQGVMSKHMASLSVGDTIDARGPQGELTYNGDGNVSIRRRALKKIVDYKVNHIGMIAGGTGITPMLQIVRHLASHPDNTRVSLIFANVTEADILLREELEQLTKKMPNFKVYLTLDKPSAEWEFGRGFVTADMIKAHLPPPSDSTMILCCGPPPMMQFMEKNLAALDYHPDQYFIY